MSFAFVARADHANHCEGSTLVGRARQVLRAIAVPLPSPVSTRARSRPYRQRAAATVSDAEWFGAACEFSTILICYDGSPGARRAVEHAGRLLPGSRAVVLNVWGSPAGLAACGLAGTAPRDFEDWMRDGVRRGRRGRSTCEGGGAGCSCTHDQRHGRGDFEIDPCSGRRVRRGSHCCRLSRSDGSTSYHCRLRFEAPRRACSTARARRAGKNAFRPERLSGT